MPISRHNNCEKNSVKAVVYYKFTNMQEIVNIFYSASYGAIVNVHITSQEYQEKCKSAENMAENINTVKLCE